MKYCIYSNGIDNKLYEIILHYIKQIKYNIKKLKICNIALDWSKFLSLSGGRHFEWRALGDSMIIVFGVLNNSLVWWSQVSSSEQTCNLYYFSPLSSIIYG